MQGCCLLESCLTQSQKLQNSALLPFLFFAFQEGKWTGVYECGSREVINIIFKILLVKSGWFYGLMVNQDERQMRWDVRFTIHHGLCTTSPLGQRGGKKSFSATMKLSVLKGIRDTPCSTPTASCKPYCKIMCGHAPLRRVQTRWLLLVVWAKLFFIKQPLFSELFGVTIIMITIFTTAQCSQFAHNISSVS